MRGGGGASKTGSDLRMVKTRAILPTARILLRITSLRMAVAPPASPGGAGENTEHSQGQGESESGSLHHTQAQVSALNIVGKTTGYTEGSEEDERATQGEVI